MINAELERNEDGIILILTPYSGAERIALETWLLSEPDVGDICIKPAWSEKKATTDE